MTLLAPWALVLLGLAVPVVAAFAYRRVSKQQRVSSLLLFEPVAASSPLPVRSLQVRHWLALLLTLLALFIGTIGLAQPVIGSGKDRNLIVVLDTSAGLGGTDANGVSLHRRALAELDHTLAGLSNGDRVALVFAGEAVRLAVGFTTDHALVRRQAAQVPLAGSSDTVAQALRVADALCTGLASGSILLLTDGTGVTASPLRCPVAAPTLGVLGDNAGIVSFSVRNAATPNEVELALAVANRSKNARSVSVQVQIPGQVAQDWAFQVPAGGVARQLRTVKASNGGPIRAAIADPDALAVDDRATAAFGLRPLPNVLLVTHRPDGYLAHLLRLVKTANLNVLSPLQAGMANNPVDLLVLENHSTPDIPQAPLVMAFGHHPQAFGIGAGSMVTHPDIVQSNPEEPLFRYSDWRAVHVFEAQLLAVTQGVEPLLTTAEGAALAVRTRFRGAELVWFGFDPEASDLVLSTTFIHLFINAIDRLAVLQPTPSARGTPDANPLDVRESLGVVHPLPSSYANTPVASRSRYTIPMHWVAACCGLLLVAETLLSGARMVRFQKVGR